MRIFLTTTVALLFIVSIYGLLQEETGLNDFSISLSGHGATTVVQLTDSNILTSDPSWDFNKSTSCTVASRSIKEGKFEWRRNVCTTSKNDSHKMVKGEGDNFVTVDRIGVIRAWSGKRLIWDAPPSKNPVSNIWIIHNGARKVVCATDGTSLLVYNAVNGRKLGNLDATQFREGSKKRTWLSVFATGSEITALVGKVDENGMTNGKHMLMVPLIFSEEKTVDLGKSASMTHSTDQFLVSTMRIQLRKERAYLLALTGRDNKLVHFSLSSSGSKISFSTVLDHPLWTSIDIIEPVNENLVRIIGQDNRYSPTKITTALFHFDGVKAWNQWYGGEEETQFENVGYCLDTNLMLAVSNGKLMAFDTSIIKIPFNGLNVVGEVPANDVILMEVVRCDQDSMSVLITTSKLTMTLFEVGSKENNAVKVNVLWTVEDGLSSVTSALLLDSTDHVVSTEVDQADISKLSLASRLKGQVEAAVSLYQNILPSPDKRNEDFGFVKLAVLLSQEIHRVWGIATTGEKRGLVDWTLDLPENAAWHSLVHGTSNSPSIVHGINGGTHSPFFLALSASDDQMDWACVDGTTGEVASSGSKSLTSPVVQTIPLFGGVGSCRQVAVLIHEDKTASIVPPDSKSMDFVFKNLNKTTNGFYSHVIDKMSNKLEALKLTKDTGEDKLKIQRVGQTSFPGEDIVEVSYPHRDEIIQSPCSILGDDSILLKYLNPHIAVIITISTGGNQEVTSDPIITALAETKTELKGSKDKRKPTGASQPGDVGATSSSNNAGEVPNLFVNVVDTVSGHVLYRVSHANASPDSTISALIVENWILYTFLNKKSRRMELGVLTLYEGMIDKTGLTAFTRPEQSLSFSSLERRESAKPVVLSKTYAVVRPVTALGVTSTRAGISTRQILIATIDDRITAVSRNLLEPRRPTGKVKEHEKQEGLFQYTPLVPLITMTSPSYNLTVTNVKHIISATTGLESQSLILAFGGPDIFFSRLSPSRGFDLLPESFNKILLMIVVVGLALVLFIVNKMSKKKVVKQGWT